MLDPKFKRVHFCETHDSMGKFDDLTGPEKNPNSWGLIIFVGRPWIRTVFLSEIIAMKCRLWELDGRVGIGMTLGKNSVPF